MSGGGEQLIQHHTFVLRPSHLPANFQTVILSDKSESEECYTLRVNLKTEDDIISWVREFGACSKTQWIFRRSNGTHILYKEYVCHHSNFHKVPKDANGCNKNGISKNASCLARIKISINTIGSKRSRDQYVRDGLCGKIRIFKIHTHALNTAKTLRFLQDRTGVLQKKFYEYFADNMTAAEAKHFHKTKLQLEGASEEDFANGNINPTSDTVYWWYKKWRLTNLGPQTGEKLISVSVPMPPASQPERTVNDCNVKDEVPSVDETLAYENDIQMTAKILVRKIRSFSTPRNSSDLRKFRKTIENISTKGMLLKFLRSGR